MRLRAVTVQLMVMLFVVHLLTLTLTNSTSLELLGDKREISQRFLRNTLSHSISNIHMNIIGYAYPYQSTLDIQTPTWNDP